MWSCRNTIFHVHVIDILIISTFSLCFLFWYIRVQEPLSHNPHLHPFQHKGDSEVIVFMTPLRKLGLTELQWRPYFLFGVTMHPRLPKAVPTLKILSHYQHMWPLPSQTSLPGLQQIWSPVSSLMFICPFSTYY